jgi:hypothetical protein
MKKHVTETIPKKYQLSSNRIRNESYQVIV